MNEEEEQSRPSGAPEASGSGGGPVDPDAGEEAPNEEELRRRLEDELRKLRVQDVLLQSVVSLINLTSRRIAKEDERDLEQARIGIEAVRGLVDLLDPEPASQVRNALSELQMLYAKQSGETPGGPPEGGEGGEQAAGERPEAPGGERKPPPGLWTPGSG
jgi:hypothetical protein